MNWRKLEVTQADIRAAQALLVLAALRQTLGDDNVDTIVDEEPWELGVSLPDGQWFRVTVGRDD